jgi:hypothetical protein
VFKYKANSLQKVARTKVLRQNIFEDQDINIRFYTRRPPIFIARLMTPKRHKYWGQSPKCQDGPLGRRGDRTGPGWAQVGQPGPFLRQFSPQFLVCEDLSTLIGCRRRHSSKTEINTPEVNHKRERLDRKRFEESTREKYSSSPRRRPQAKEDVEVLPRCPRS